MVVFCYSDAIADTQWLVSGEDGGTRIAFLLGKVPVAVVTCKCYVELSFLHLGFLKAEKVSVKGLESVFKALADTGPEAVDVP